MSAQTIVTFEVVQEMKMVFVFGISQIAVKFLKLGLNVKNKQGQGRKA